MNEFDNPSQINASHENPSHENPSHDTRGHEYPSHETLGAQLAEQGISRRAFLKFCAAMASLMALPPGTATAIAEALIKAKRPSVIWLSFQECTGCTESLTRSYSPTLENMIFDMISLDYHHTLQAASGYGAEKSREDAMQEFLRQISAGGRRLDPDA